MPATEGVLWVFPLANDEKVSRCQAMGEPALAAHCTAVLTVRAGRWALLPNWVFWQATRRVFAGWTPSEAYDAAVRLVEAAGRGPVLVPNLARPEPPALPVPRPEPAPAAAPAPEPEPVPKPLFGGLTMGSLRDFIFGAA